MNNYIFCHCFVLVHAIHSILLWLGFDLLTLHFAFRCLPFDVCFSFGCWPFRSSAWIFTILSAILLATLLALNSFALLFLSDFDFVEFAVNLFASVLQQLKWLQNCSVIQVQQKSACWLSERCHHNQLLLTRLTELNQIYLLTVLLVVYQGIITSVVQLWQ